MLMMIYVTLVFSLISLIASSLGKLAKQEFGKNENAYWVTQFEPCSVTCGGGVQRTYPECWIAETQVNKTLCDPYTRPRSEYRPCALEPCSVAPRWQLSEWTTCSSKCGPGVRRRVARCVLYISTTRFRYLEEGMCPTKKRPPEEVANCHSGVVVPCPPFASPDVMCFSPPCRTETGPGSGFNLLPSDTLTFLLITVVILYS